jgi:eukaryotic-like serine/threonine-protein kinase
MIGFGVVKLLSASANNPQPSLTKIAIKSTPIASINNQQNWGEYLDQTARIKINYTNTWAQDRVDNVLTGENVVFTSPKQNPVDRYQENVSIRIENLTDAQTNLSTYTQSAISEISKYYQSAKIIELSAIVLAKQPAKLVVYTGVDEKSLPIKNLEVWTIDRGKVYILTYKAEPDQYYQFLETVMAMINSFELK